MRTCAQCSREKPPRAFPPRRAGFYPGYCSACASASAVADALAEAGIPLGEALSIAEAAAAAGLGRRTLVRAAATGRLRTIRVGAKRYTTARWVAMWRAAWRDDGGP